MTTTQADPKPYKVYYWTSNGRRGLRSFATRKGQASFITNAPMGYVITFWN